MKCPYCSVNRDRVVDSRESRDGATIRRRRECLDCGRRFTSYEAIEDIPYMVVKSDGTREEYNRKKLLGGLFKACEKRPVPAKRLEELADEAEVLLHDREEREIETQEIGAFVMDRLRELDQVAYVRFASVYRRFEDVESFMDVLKGLVGGQELAHEVGEQVGGRQGGSGGGGPSKGARKSSSAKRWSKK